MVYEKKIYGISSIVDIICYSATMQYASTTILSASAIRLVSEGFGGTLLCSYLPFSYSLQKVLP